MQWPRFVIGCGLDFGKLGPRAASAILEPVILQGSGFSRCIEENVVFVPARIILMGAHSQLALTIDASTATLAFSA